MNPRSPDPAAPSAAGPTAHPLWPLALVLAEIADRVARRRADEHAPDSEGEGDQHDAG